MQISDRVALGLHGSGCPGESPCRCGVNAGRVIHIIRREAGIHDLLAAEIPRELMHNRAIISRCPSSSVPIEDTRLGKCRVSRFTHRSSEYPRGAESTAAPLLGVPPVISEELPPDCLRFFTLSIKRWRNHPENDVIRVDSEADNPIGKRFAVRVYAM